MVPSTAACFDDVRPTNCTIGLFALCSRSHIQRVRVSIVLLAASMLALPARLSGQRMSCAHADSVLRSDERRRQDRIEAIGRTIYCPDTRVAAFTVLLRGSRPNSIADTLARLAAWTLLDPRLVDSVAVLSKDARQPRQKRVFYLALLTRYSDCGISVDMSAIDRPMAKVTGGISDACGSDDRHALPRADRDRARAAIAWMGEHDPDDRLRQLAAAVSEELTVVWTAGLQTPSRPR